MNRSPTSAEKAVAAALMQHLGGNQAITGCQYKLAQAAIRALRTKEMAEAGGDTLDNCRDSDYSSDADGNRHEYETIHADAPAKVFAAMIDAASPPEPI